MLRIIDDTDKKRIIELSASLIRNDLNEKVGFRGTARDVTDIIHFDNIQLAERAVKTIGLDIAGVDIVLVVDGSVVDLNRIQLPADTPIIDRRFAEL